METLHRATVILIVSALLCSWAVSALQDGPDGPAAMDGNSPDEESRERRADNGGCDVCSRKVDALGDDLKSQFDALSLRVDTLSSILEYGLGNINRILQQLEQTTTVETTKTIQLTTTAVVVTARDCRDVGAKGNTTSGLYVIAVGDQRSSQEMKVFCDFVTPGGGWLVFQRRKDGSVNFTRSWNEYGSGFGDPSGEFWIGNDILYQLMSQKKYKLRIDLEDFEGQKRYAEYSQFSVGSAAEYYKLTVGGYSGNAGDSLAWYHNGMKFSTIDADNDAHSGGSCARWWRGGWWYNACHYSNLNGLYLGGNRTDEGQGINWYHWHGYDYSLKTTEMKIAPVD